jgi:hypothetical protein
VEQDVLCSHLESELEGKQVHIHAQHGTIDRLVNDAKPKVSALVLWEFHFFYCLFSADHLTLHLEFLSIFEKPCKIYRH